MESPIKPHKKLRLTKLRLLKAFLVFFLALLLTIGNSWFPLLRSNRAIATDASIQQASQLYESGQYQQAKSTWQRAVEAAPDETHRAVALGNLALTLYQLGEWQAADQAITPGLKLLGQKPSATYAQLLDIQGHLEFGRGRFQSALETWQQAADIYKNARDAEGLGINQLNQAQAMQMLGLFNQAGKLLDDLQSGINQQDSSLLKVRKLRSLLEVSAKLGRIEQIDQAQSLAQATERSIAQLPVSQQAAEKAALLLTLGNITRSFAERSREVTSATGYQTRQTCKTYLNEETPKDAKDKAQAALKQYRQVSELIANGPPNSPIEVALQSNLNQLDLNRELGISSPDLLPQITGQIQQIPVSRSRIFAQIHLAQSLLCDAQVPDETIATYLSQAIASAQQIQDKRAESHATGTLGKLYEQQAETLKLPQQLSYAQKLTEKALLLANSIEAADISYQWQWQLGRILRDLGGAENQQKALEVYYPNAVKSLETVRGELIGTNPDVQFSFRDDAEPVYREYVDLLLSEANPSPERLKKAIELIDSLQVAELENFFRCVLSQLVQVSQVSKESDPEAATFYPIILHDRLEVILQLPNQEVPIRYTQMIPNAEAAIDKTVFKLQEALVDRGSAGREYKEPGEQLYRWLLQGAEPYLQKAGVKTLVFVLDGALREVPIMALWDGQQFVIQKYAVAVTPGLNLLGPKRFEQQAFRALIGGLTGDQPIQLANSRQSVGALPYVKQEIQKLQDLIPESTVLRDQQFVPNQLNQALKRRSYPIVHLATHGQFDNNPKNTYLVTADGQQINLDSLQEMLRTGKGNRRDALELLMLSACQTAAGNRRATLGMAGVAIRSGASSTVATLWSVDDQSTSRLVEAFYRNLKRAIEQPDGTTKVQALRQAQLALLGNKLPSDAAENAVGKDFSHPYYWAPFILLGNWL
jgi:CHAT domain-containing protein/tetratricopeptide (TPR) repeat protein